MKVYKFGSYSIIESDESILTFGFTHFLVDSDSGFPPVLFDKLEHRHGELNYILVASSEHCSLQEQWQTLLSEMFTCEFILTTDCVSMMSERICHVLSDWKWIVFL